MVGRRASWVVLGVVAIAVVAGVATQASRSRTSSSGPAPRHALGANNSEIEGRPSAPVLVEEYADYQCPACGQAYPIIKALLGRLGQRVRFVFRNFPLATVHPHAEGAAEAA